MIVNKQIPLEIAAGKAGTTTLNLLMHIKRGLLSAAEHQGCWFINEAELNAFIADKRKADSADLCVHSGCGKGCGSCAEEE
ncbi:MAG: hypothetical protein R6V33_04585 [Pelovirga sp.]